MLTSVLNELKSQINTIGSNSVTFHNGCWLSLINEDGMYAATDPYGQDKYFDAERALDAIPNWIAFWNTPRDERGNQIVITKD